MDKNLDPRFLPNHEANFESLDVAYEFYRAYTELAGFPIKKNRTRTNGKEFNCSFDGKHKMKIGNDRRTSKTSKRDGRDAHFQEERIDDIPKLQTLLRECKINNPQFFRESQLDEKNVVRNVFWSNASQQGDYADDSSVMTFDTTYRTNHYSMPLAMFIGFNNQLRNVVFGPTLLRDERADIVHWLFRQFRVCMGGNDPIVVSTDFTSIYYGYDKQLSRVYTRAVYKEFTCRYKSSTAFHVRPDSSKANYCLVKHTRPPTNFPWLCHEFWVKPVVNEEMLEESEFNCECMRIEPTVIFEYIHDIHRISQ
ncbi:protein FAR1-RELATED SEQUENCE 5-like [Panicum miliaceum]|uniref:Protein FAR1-RELATED SEQUENCE n=1 Tax=Panicum miliaceum TaxID=4540 RepID=A0A3L6Q2L8_PANMI|nr:protein FAR1-RELATED SEQUENCE 5-like [Panicum miliaceum]